MTCLNEDFITHINKSITDISISCHDLRMCFDILKNTLTNNTEPTDETSTVHNLLQIMNYNINKLDNEINLIELDKLDKLNQTKQTKQTKPNQTELDNMEELDQYISPDTDYIKYNKIHIISPKLNNLFDDVKCMNINSVYFDIMQIDQTKSSDRKILTDLAFEIINSYVDLTEINIDPNKLRSYIELCSTFYNINPYHNLNHAVSVLQFAYLLLNHCNMGEHLSPIQSFAILISAYVHDIDHPGHTNDFEQKIKSPLSHIYNSSILENHHCSTAFYLMHLKDINLLENLSLDSFNLFRETMIQTIILTDMKYHNMLINKINTELKNGWMWNSKTRMIIAETIVHAADLNNQIRPFNISKYGSKCLKKEFDIQVQKELKLELPIMDYMNIKSDKELYLSEYNFCQNIMQPFWEKIYILNPNTKQLYEQLIINTNEWLKLSEN
jgi:hypothetical protein